MHSDECEEKKNWLALLASVLKRAVAFAPLSSFSHPPCIHAGLRSAHRQAGPAPAPAPRASLLSWLDWTGSAGPTAAPNSKSTISGVRF